MYNYLINFNYSYFIQHRILQQHYCNIAAMFCAIGYVYATIVIKKIFFK